MWTLKMVYLMYIVQCDTYGRAALNLYRQLRFKLVLKWFHSTNMNERASERAIRYWLFSELQALLEASKEFMKFAKFSHLMQKPSLFVCVSIMVIIYRHRKEIWIENNNSHNSSSKSGQSKIDSQVDAHTRFREKKFGVFYARMLLLCQIFTCTW